MTGLEPILTALKRGQPDRVPLWELLIDRRAIEALHGNISYEEFVEREGLDGITVFPNSKKWRLDSDTYKDEWGIIWRIGADGLTYPHEGPIKSEKDLDTFQAPDPDAEYRFEAVKEAVKRFKGEKAIVFLGHEAFEYSWYLMGGMENLFMNYGNPDFIKRLAEVAWSYQGRLLDNMAQAGVDVLLTGDDFAGTKGPLMSPRHFQEFVLPYLQKSVFVTAGVFIFIDTWNDFLWPMVVTMGHPELMTMPVGLAFFSQSYVTYWGASMAMATLFTVPVVVVYLFFQRYFVEFIALSGLKG